MEGGERADSDSQRKRGGEDGTEAQEGTAPREKEKDKGETDGRGKKAEQRVSRRIRRKCGGQPENGKSRSCKRGGGGSGGQERRRAKRRERPKNRWRVRLGGAVRERYEGTWGRRDAVKQPPIKHSRGDKKIGDAGRRRRAEAIRPRNTNGRPRGHNKINR